MKTVSTVKDRNGIDVKYSPVDGEFTQSNSSETLPAHGLNESDNLIICDSQLASSFQEVKISKTRLKPGHYLQKVFLHKLKSQSVPSLDKSKISNGVSDNSEPVKDINNGKLSSSPEKEKSNDESVDREANDSWYRTWPDCGIDKVRNGIVLDNNASKDNILTDGESDEVTVKCRSVVTSRNTIVCDSVVKKNGAIPIDNLLENLPIAYSPITKQIHLISSVDNCDNVKRTPVDKLDEIKCSDSFQTLPRINTEVSSFSSTVSSLSDVSPSTNGDSAVGSLFDNGDNCSLLSIGNCSIVSDDSGGSKPKRKGISSFFSRGVFGWKGKCETTGDGWSLFSKGSDSDGSRPSSALSEDRRSLGSDSVLGSTGLIQLERPAWLPAKPKQEQKAHSYQHEKILQTIRKRELKEAKHRKKVLQNQLKVEDELANATKVWTQEILPKWPEMRNNKRTQDLWWQGVPPCVRGRLWRLAIGNDLNITHDLYEICVQRAQDRLRSASGSMEALDEPCIDSDREGSMELIQLDISRTFPHLCIFQKRGPYYEMLHSLLAAYACYRPDVGYVQGMSFIAAVLILNMDPPEAFACFANLLNRPCHRAFYSLDQYLMQGYYATYNDLLKENLPKLCEHLKFCNLTPDLYLLDWVYTVFAKAMNIDLASRVWDVFLRDGDEFIFRTAIGVLKICEETLMTMDFVSGSQYLTRLPDLCPVKLFAAISSVKMSVGKQSFANVLQSYTHCD